MKMMKNYPHFVKRMNYLLAVVYYFHLMVEVVFLSLAEVALLLVAPSVLVVVVLPQMLLN
jgi:hypothetical protein